MMRVSERRGPSTSAWAKFGARKGLPFRGGTIYGPGPQEARARGVNALAVTHHRLATDPDYQSLMREVQSEDEEH